MLVVLAPPLEQPHEDFSREPEPTTDVVRKTLYKSASCLVLAWPATMPAEPDPALGVESRCDRLSARELDELSARVMLRLAAAPEPHPPPTVVCTEQAAWVEWEGRRIEVPGRAGLVDEVVAVIEDGLEPAAPLSPSEPAAAAPARAELPPLEDSPPAREPERHIANRGGIALGLESELPSERIGIALGPSFDEGINLGPLTVGARQAFRFTLAEPQVSFMDFEGALAWGAPFRAGAPLGVVVRAGVECLVAHPRGAVEVGLAPVAGLGIRAARDFDVVGLWLGVDARLRLRPLRAGAADPIAASDFTASFSVGVSLLDSKRGQRRR
jgi:hypothetical protein